MLPLDDLRVLSFTHAAAGPYAGWLLHEWGADVVKVEPPDGAFERTSARHHHYLSNRGKKSLAIDLKAEAGRQAVLDLLPRFDVVLESYRPGVMERLGLGYEELASHHEGLVYCSLSGFGDSGPYRNRPAYDPIAQALSGVMDMTGNPDRKPSRVGGPLVDLGTATNAVLAVMLALHERERTGRGKRVEASLLETAYGWGGMWSVFYTLHDEVPHRMGDKIGSYAPVGVYETADGEVYLSGLGDPTWRKLADALGLGELTEDPRFEAPDARRANRETLDDLIEERTREYATDDLVDHLLERNVPVAEIKSVPEVLEDEHLQARGMITDARTHEGKAITAPGVPMKLADTSPVGGVEPPALGAHSVEVVEEVYAPERVRQLVDDGVLVRPDE